MSVRRNLAWMGLAQGAMFVVQFGGSIVIARLLDPVQMGVYAAAAAVLAILNLFRSVGLNTFLIREPVLTRSVTATLFTLNAALNLLTSGVIVAISLLGEAVLGDAAIAPILRLLALGPLLNLFDFLPSAHLERAGAFRTVGAVNVAKTLLATGVTLALAADGYGSLSIAWGNLAAALLSVVVVNAVAWRSISLRPGLQDWRRIARFGGQMLTLGTLDTLVAKSTDLMVGRIIGLGALGLYSRASGLNGLLWDNMQLVITRVLVVDFAEHVRRGLSLRETYLRIVALLTALLWPALTGMAIVAGPLVQTIYGEAWAAAALPLSMLSLAGVMYVAIAMTSEIYITTGRLDLQLRLELRRNAIGVALFAAGCMGGLPWAAASRIGDGVAAVLLARRDLQRLTQTRPEDYPPIYAQSALLTVLACAPAFVVMLGSGWSPHARLAPLAGAITLGVAAWGAGLWRLRHPLYNEAMGTVRKMAPRAWRHG